MCNGYCIMLEEKQRGWETSARVTRNIICTSTVTYHGNLQYSIFFYIQSFWNFAFNLRLGSGFQRATQHATDVAMYGCQRKTSLLTNSPSPQCVLQCWTDKSSETEGFSNTRYRYVAVQSHFKEYDTVSHQGKSSILRGLHRENTLTIVLPPRYDANCRCCGDAFPEHVKCPWVKNTLSHAKTTVDCWKALNFGCLRTHTVSMFGVLSTTCFSMIPFSKSTVLEYFKVHFHTSMLHTRELSRNHSIVHKLFKNQGLCTAPLVAVLIEWHFSYT